MILKYLSPCIDQKGVTELSTCTLFKNKFGYLFSLAVQNTQPVPSLMGNYSLINCILYFNPDVSLSQMIMSYHDVMLSYDDIS